MIASRMNQAIYKQFSISQNIRLISKVANAEMREEFLCCDPPWHFEWSGTTIRCVYANPTSEGTSDPS